MAKKKTARKSERAYIAWHPEFGFAMWTLAGTPRVVRRSFDNIGDSWRIRQASGWRVRRVLVKIA